ncbi:uncharacterized protein RB166_016023 [Leptodactylus fuscus]|uniref:uncharacterized protein LOC142217155 n=1 Tax=Leptodactylus fuscus TaxID=238119 RepID=UPI003F4F25B9
MWEDVSCQALEVTVPPSHIGILQTDVLLPCTFKVGNNAVNLQYLAIFWNIGEKEILKYDSKTKGFTSRFTIDEQKVTRGDASLTIRNVTVSDKGTYRCTVVYSPDQQGKNIQLNILAVPVVKIQKKAVQRGVTSLLQCSITDFFPQDMSTIWLKNGQILSGSVTQDETNKDKTFTRTSSVNVTFLEERGNPEMTCQVEHNYLQEPVKDSYIVEYGAAPSVNIKTSKTPDGKTQIYMCEATNYSPQAVKMNWLFDGKRIDSSIQERNGYFNKEIYYQIQLEENNRPSEISCEVEHETLHRPIKTTQEIKVENDCRRSCHFGLIGVLVGLLVTSLPALWYFMKKDSQRFQVGHIHRMDSVDDKVTMYCLASNCPQDVQVTWTILENDGEKIIISDNKQGIDEETPLNATKDYSVETDRSHSHKLYNAISMLSFTPVVSKHKKMEVFCKFHCNGRSQEKRLECSFNFKKPEPPGPVQLSLGDNGDVLCSVTVSKFYPKNIRIQWSHGLGHFQDAETIRETFTKNDDFTFNVRSECRVPGHLFKDQGYRVRATWSHGEKSGQQEVSITDCEWHLVMGKIEKPTFIDGKEAKLLCQISGYFPDALDVTWLRRAAESQEFYVISASDKYKIPVVEATQQEDKTFTVKACLVLSVSAAEDYGSEIMCRVRHPSLETPLEKKTGELQVIGIRAVNVKLLSKDKLRAEVLYFTPNKGEDIEIKWSRCKDNQKYEEYKDITSNIYPNGDGNYTGVCEITLKSHTLQMKQNERKYYKVIVKHYTSNSVIEKIILRENGTFYLTDKDKKIPLGQFSEQTQDININAETEMQKPLAGIRDVRVSYLATKKLKVEVLHFIPKDIKITWKKREHNNYNEYKDVIVETKENSDGTYTTSSEIKSEDKSKEKHYKVVVEHSASNSVIEKKILRKDGKHYLIDGENRVLLLPETTMQNTDTQREEEEPTSHPMNIEEE